MLDALPLTANGKVDREALSVPPAGAAAEAAGDRGSGTSGAGDPLRELVALTWAKVLGVERVHDEDDFAALAGIRCWPCGWCTCCGRPSG